MFRLHNEVYGTGKPAAGPKNGPEVAGRHKGTMTLELLTGLRHSCRPMLIAAVVTCCLIPPCMPDAGHAQATSSITSSGLNTTVTASGNMHVITGGTRPGSGPNLFHSFGEFGVPTNHVANFLNDSGLATSNILGRVTGGNPSNILGTLQTTGFGSANLLLMNPAGIVFGPNASLNVGGSVSFTTADYLRLSDGAKFNALPGPQDAAISSAPVAAFGFLGSNPAAITVQGSQLAVAEGHSLSLVGGNIDVTAGVLPAGTSQSARLSAPAGPVTLVSVASPGEVITNNTVGPTAEPALSGFASLGTISLSGGAAIDSSAGSAGPIVIRGGHFIMENAELTAHSTALALSPPSSSPSEGRISIQADEASLSHGSKVLTSTINGTAGDISFEVGTLRSNVGPDGIALQGAAPVTISSVSTGQGAPGIISIKGQEGLPADAVLLSNTRIVTNVTSAVNHFIPPTPPSINTDPPPPAAQIEITAEHVELTNGTVLQATTTGGADAGSITLNVGTLKTREGPEGRVLISSSSECGQGCFGGQAGDITIQGIPGITPAETHFYVPIVKPESDPTVPITYQVARSIDLQGTEIRSEAIGNAPGGQVLMRAQGQVSLSDTTISVATQDFNVTVDPVMTPSGQRARNQGFSRIDVLARDVFLKDSTIRADAEVSEPGSCPTCTGGPAAGEIWFRVGNSLTAENSSILNTSRGRAQAGITKIIKDNYFSFGAIWEPDFPDLATNSVKLTNSEITVEARDVGMPGILRIRAHDIALDHSILNSKVNNVTNARTIDGDLIDVVGGGERGRTISNGREVQGSVLLSGEKIDITGGGIVATTQGERIASRIEIHAGDLTTQPGTRPGATLDAPRILNPADPTRVVISSSSTGIGGAGLVSITGVSVPQPENTPFPPTSSIHMRGTDVLTETRSDALGGRIEVKSAGPVQLKDTTISANVNDLRAQSLNRLEQSGNVDMSVGSLAMQGGTISALSTGSQVGGNVSVAAQTGITISDGASLSANSSGSGNAGNIAINAGAQFLSQNSSITTEAAQASGGNILIQATDAIRVVNSHLSTSVQGGPNSSGGNITLDPAVVTLQNSQVLAQAVQGAGGNINIIAGTFLADPTSVVSASSQFGLSGSVNIQSPVSSLSNTLTTLPQRPLQAPPLLTQHCAAQTNGHMSSLVVSGRDALPSEPGGWQMSPLVFMADAKPAEQGQVITNLASGVLYQRLVDQPVPSSQRRVWNRETGCGS